MGPIQFFIIISLVSHLLISCGNTGLEAPEALQEEQKVSEVPSAEPVTNGSKTRVVSSRFAGLSNYHGQSEHFQIKGAGFSEYAYGLETMQLIIDGDLLTATQLGVDNE